MTSSQSDSIYSSAKWKFIWFYLVNMYGAFSSISKKTKIKFQLPLLLLSFSQVEGTFE